MNSPVVVVADDDPAIRRLLGHVVHRAGYRAHAAMDVPEAMEHLMRPGVAAAIVDMLFINSGGRSGLDLLRFIRADATLSRLPVIVLTGFPLNRGVLSEVAALDAELWHKPFDLPQLTERIQQLIRGSGRPDGSAENSAQTGVEGR